MRDFLKGCGLVIVWLIAMIIIAVFAFLYFVLGDTIAAAAESLISGFVLFAKIGGVLSLVALAAIVAVIVWGKWSKRRNDNMRQLNGSHAARQFVDNHGRTHHVSPSDMPGGSFTFDPELGVQPLTLGLSPALVAVLIQGNNAVRGLQASFAGDDVLGRIGEQVIEPKIPAAAMRPQKPPSTKVLEQQPALLPAPRVVMPTITEGTQNDTPRSFALGYGGDGQIVRWHSERNPHLRVHGSSQVSGKTNLLKLIASAALAKGAHVIVVDRRRFKDWQDFKGRAEFVDASNPENFANAVRSVHDEFDMRDREIAAAGVPNLDGLPGGNIPRLIMIISEFGSTWTDAKADGLTGEIEKPLIDMARMSGATGVHILFEDQVPDKATWPRALVANATPVSGRNDKMYGTLVGHDKPHTIPAYSFAFNGAEPFRSWDMTAPDAKQIVAGLPMLNGYRVIDGDADAVPAAVPAAVPGNVHSPVRTVPPEVPPPTPQPANGANGGTWAALVHDWFTANPDRLHGRAQGISDIARHMSVKETGNDSSYENYKSLAHKLFHEYRASPPTGDR